MTSTLSDPQLADVLASLAAAGQAPVAETASAVAQPTTAPGMPDEEDVTPGLAGFLATFFVAVAVVLLSRSLMRRVRRLRAQETMPSPFPITERGDSTPADEREPTAESQPGTHGAPGNDATGRDVEDGGSRG